MPDYIGWRMTRRRRAALGWRRRCRARRGRPRAGAGAAGRARHSPGESSMTRRRLAQRGAADRRSASARAPTDDHCSGRRVHHAGSRRSAPRRSSPPDAGDDARRRRASRTARQQQSGRCAAASGSGRSRCQSARVQGAASASAMHAWSGSYVRLGERRGRQARRLDRDDHCATPSRRCGPQPAGRATQAAISRPQVRIAGVSGGIRLRPICRVAGSGRGER